MDALRGVERRRNSQFDGAGTVHLTEWVQYNRPVSLTDAIQLAEDHLLMSMAALLSPSPSTFLALTSHPPTIAVLLTFLSGISHCSLSEKSNSMWGIGKCTIGNGKVHAGRSCGTINQFWRQKQFYVGKTAEIFL